MNICQTCHRTDAFTPGRIDHDKKWHESIEWIENVKEIKHANGQSFLSQWYIEAPKADLSALT